MYTNTRWGERSWSDWADQVDAPTPSSADAKSDLDSFVDDALDFAREMVECAMAPLRDLIANGPPPFGRRHLGSRAPRAPWADD
jgi:hypothetical protein